MIAAPKFIYKSFEVHVGGSKQVLVVGLLPLSESRGLRVSVTSLNTRELFWFRRAVHGCGVLARSGCLLLLLGGVCG
jgi:hypothetical protein